MFLSITPGIGYVKYESNKKRPLCTTSFREMCVLSEYEMNGSDRINAVRVRRHHFQSWKGLLIR